MNNKPPQIFKNLSEKVSLALDKDFTECVNIAGVCIAKNWGYQLYAIALHDISVI